jgi:hypothetical protein
MTVGGTKYDEMAGHLKLFGTNAGFAALGTAVVVIGPGAPFTVSPTSYSAADLEKAVEAGVLERRKLSGSFTLDTYAVKAK